jgi:hypothetical protein
MTLVHAPSWRYLIRRTPRRGVVLVGSSCRARCSQVVLGAESEFWGSRRSCRSCGCCGRSRVRAGRRWYRGVDERWWARGTTTPSMLTVAGRSQPLHPVAANRPRRHAGRPQLSTGAVDNAAVVRVTRGERPGCPQGCAQGWMRRYTFVTSRMPGGEHAVTGAKLRPGVDSICTQGCGQPVDNSRAGNGPVGGRRSEQAGTQPGISATAA